MTTDRERFLAERRKGIGGSDIAAIMGMDPYGTPLSVYRSKVSDADDGSDEDGPLWWGNFMEPGIMARYAYRMRQQVTKPQPNLFVRDGWKMCHPDAFALLDDGLLRNVQIKTVQRADSEDASTRWGDAGSDEIPDHVRIQVLWEMHVLSDTVYIDPVSHVAAMIGPPTRDDLRIYNVEQIPSVLSVMIDAADRFWHENVLPRVPPPPSSLIELHSVSEVKGKTIRASDADIAAMFDYADACDSEKGAKARKDMAQFQLKVALGDAEAIVDESGEPLVTFKTATDGSRRFALTSNWRRRRVCFAMNTPTVIR